ncbi:MAG TPA: hypothetical protein PKU96_05840 [bacterium]|nr:hypothetical protein [Myxococcales bacterium]HPW45872.1 hypothetical protein [bacterium]
MQIYIARGCEMKIPAGIIMEKMRRERREREMEEAHRIPLIPVDEMRERPESTHRDRESEKVIVIEL